MDRASPRDAALLLGATLCAGVVVVAAARAISSASRRRTMRKRGAAKRAARDATRGIHAAGCALLGTGRSALVHGGGARSTRAKGRAGAKRYRGGVLRCCSGR